VADRLHVTRGPAVGTILQLEDVLELGRTGGTASVFEQDLEVSRTHARIARSARGGLILQDLDSSNGTYLNGWKIPSAQILSDGDVIQVGNTVLKLDAGAEAPARSAVVSGVHGAEARPAASGSILYVTGVKKSYGDLTVLRGVDLEIQPGEIVGLLGPNGAGKTTFVSIVAGLRSADAGEVSVAGVDALRRPREARKHLGIAPQDLGIYAILTVRRNLRFFGELAGLEGKLLDERVEEVATALSLDPLFERRAGTLSGGQKRRLHAGMAMLHHPPLLILDEPTVGADIRTRQEILELVKKLAAEGRAICYCTHYLPEVENLGASVAILQGGEIIARGSIAELVAKHTSPFVELTFEGPPPEIVADGEVTREDSVVRIKTREPSAVAAAVIGRLGADAGRLRDLEIIRPSLDSLYLSLTEQRYSPGDEPQAAADEGTDEATPARRAAATVVAGLRRS
jgi:ABC-2 type transport system ATP-binding protein